MNQRTLFLFTLLTFGFLAIALLILTPSVRAPPPLPLASVVY